MATLDLANGAGTIPEHLSTPLSRRLLTDAGSTKGGPLAAFKVARRQFVAGERIDMTGLAAQFDVDRATLFRWVGNREQLMTEVIWSTGGPAWRIAMDGSRGRGATRVVDAFTRFVSDITGTAYFTTYLRREKDRALRLLTSKAGVHQARVAACFEGILAHEQNAGELSMSLAPHDMAYVMTRIAESFIYSDLITGEIPDADKAATAVAAMLGVRR